MSDELIYFENKLQTLNIRPYSIYLSNGIVSLEFVQGHIENENNLVSLEEFMKLLKPILSKVNNTSRLGFVFENIDSDTNLKLISLNRKENNNIEAVYSQEPFIEFFNSIKIDAGLQVNITCLDNYFYEQISKITDNLILKNIYISNIEFDDGLGREASIRYSFGQSVHVG